MKLVNESLFLKLDENPSKQSPKEFIDNWELKEERDLVPIQPLCKPLGTVSYLDYVFKQTKWQKLKQNIKGFLLKIKKWPCSSTDRTYLCER